MKSKRVFIGLFAAWALGLVIGIYLAHVAHAEAEAKQAPPTAEEQAHISLLDMNSRWMSACLLLAERAYKDRFGTSAPMDKDLVVAIALRLYDTTH